MNGERAALDAAIEALRTAVARKRPITHYHARDLLVALGERVLAGDAELDERVRALRKLLRPLDEPWREAVGAELRMACTEHCQSVDPRYLDLPNYDFAYTLEARERLEARLRACARLGLDVDEELLERVARADEQLEPYLRDERRGS